MLGRLGTQSSLEEVEDCLQVKAGPHFGHFSRMLGDYAKHGSAVDAMLVHIDSCKVPRTKVYPGRRSSRG